MRLVIKLHGADGTSRSRSDFERFAAAVDNFPCRDKIVVINELFTDNEAKNLIRCCDCVISLHRSEGFGRVMGEAMLLDKPVVATGYSGNLDFMSDSNSCLVQYKLVEVPKDSYPHAQGQVWAEPDVGHAAFYMLKLLDNRDFGRELGQTASRHIRTHFSHRAIGLKYRIRMDEIFCAKSPAENVRV